MCSLLKIDAMRKNWQIDIFEPISYNANTS